jgi:quercetin dioxygenase-like cupin family protein
MNPATTRRRFLVGALVGVSALASNAARKIPMQKLDLLPPRSAGKDGVRVRRVLPGEVKEVTIDLVSILGPGRHTEPSNSDREVVWLILAGKGTLQTNDRTYGIEGETIARAPNGWPWQIEVPRGEVLHALRVRRQLTEDDKAELKKYPGNNAVPYVKKFGDCPAYREAIKSPKTVSRALLPENYVPRMAVGTVETTGPDTVGLHRHPMLEQLFLGLKDNDITVSADEAKANLKAFSILHIPLGSNHGAEVATGKKLYYVWMDFFISKQGQEWLKMHKPVEQNP